MKRVLLIAHEFPPRMSSGVFRILRFLKYLPRAGWQPTLLTADFWGRALTDPALNSLVPHGVRIFRAPSPDLFLPFRSLRRIGLGALQERLWAATDCPDHHIGWVPPACYAANRAFRFTAFDAVFSSAPPYSAHLIGLWLRRHRRVPWVADFRDHWSLNPYRTDQPAPTARLNRGLERRVLASATAVTAVSDPMRDQLASLAPDSPDTSRFFTVTNAFDPDLFEASASAPDPGKFVISYVGSLNVLRTIITFCSALEQALTKGAVDSSRILVRFLSNTIPDCSPVIAPVLTCGRWVSHARALRYMLQSHVLLLIMAPRDGVAIIPGKLFEYLGARRTVLALAPTSGAAARIVRDTHSGIVVDPDDVPGIAGAIALLYDRWRRGLLSSPLDPRDVAVYDGEVVTRRLSHVLDWAVNRRAHGRDKNLFAGAHRHA